MTNKSIGQQLAALRRVETKNCECGTEFIALAKVTKCKRCRDKDRQQKYRRLKKDDDAKND